jgi:Zn-dependent M32 family carboxypeptidase
VLLDDYEPGMKTADVRRLFDSLRQRQVAIIKACRPGRARVRISDSLYAKATSGGLPWTW